MNMFKFFKEKIGKWTKKVSEEVKESPEEIKEESKVESKPEKSREEKAKKITVKQDVEEEKSGFLKKVTGKFSRIKITEKEFEVLEEELRMLLLENNVAFEVADKIIENLREEVIGKELLKKEVESEIKEVLKKIIGEILIEPFDVIEKIKEKKESPYVILLAGVNGTGKTTTVAKLADFLKKKKFSCVLAAADTFRAASIEQIEKHGERIGVKVISHEYNSDPASVGFDAIKYAEKNSIDIVLIDTAGRMHSSKNLLKELEKIAKVCKPDLKIFIGESTTGNDSVEQIKSFDWAINIDGIILTKADVDEKGGTALSVGYVTKKPVLFLGVGQGMGDIIPFNKEDFIKKLGL